jgi:hypothetical protein
MNNSGSKVVLHIGGQKCGSSALQGYLFFGRYILKRHNVHYLEPELVTNLDQEK